jgi:predicted porin
MDNFRHQIGDNRIVIGDKGAFDARVSNMIRYESPSISGWNVNALQTSNNGPEATSTSGKVNSVSVTWSSGPLFLGLGWEEQGFGTSSDASGNRLVGSYTFNDITLGLLWDTLSDIGGVSGHDRDALGLFATMKMGNNKFKFHYLDADKYDDSATADGGSVWAIGVDHNFSKTAMIYFNYVSVDNDTAGTFNTTSPSGHGDTLATTAGKSPTAYSVGTILKF